MDETEEIMTIIKIFILFSHILNAQFTYIDKTLLRNFFKCDGNTKLFGQCH